MGTKEIEEKIREIEGKGKKKSKPRKKKIAVIVLVLALGTLVGLGIVFRDQLLSFFQGKKDTSPLGARKEREKFNFNWALWKDAAGFSFEYPRELEIDVHAEDESNYSFLTLTSKERKGKIDIICNDSQYRDINDWRENDSLVKPGSGLETKIASLSAQKVALGNGREITGLIDWDEVIYVVDKNPEGEIDYWSAIYAHILDTFKLTPLEGETEEQFSQWLEGFDTAGADVVEAVEIIE